MKKLFSVFIVSLVTISLFSQQIAPFKAGDRAVFLGNSITDGGYYHSYIWLYYMTRFPDMQLRIFNAGIGGDCVSHMYKRFDGDVLSKNPTVLMVTFGMNDSGYFEYNGDNPQQFADKKVQECYDNYLPLEKRLQGLTHTRVVLMGSSPYDQTAQFEGNLFKKKNDAMLRIVDFQKISAKQNHWEFLDLNRPVTAINEKGQQTNPAFTICGGDRIHPDNDGHMVMAYLFLKAQGFGGKEVASMDIDAQAKKVKESGNCKITNLQVSPAAVRFDYLAKSLPYPLDTIARGWGNKRGQAQAVQVVPFMEEMNKELLKVEGLSGSYRLLIDGQQIGVWTAADFAKGINLAEQSTTPQYQQALKVMYLNEERWEIERRFRELAWVQFNFLKDKGLLNADNREALDMIDANVANDGWLRGRRDIYSKGMSPEIRKTWENEMELIINTIYTINKPVKHTITLEKVSTSNPDFFGWSAGTEGDAKANSSAGAQQNLVQYVNTLQGTDSNFGLSYGNTYPTVALPFGMHFWSAQTGRNGDGWKYQYAANTIRGFEEVHQCSPWMGDYGVFSLMPVAGKLIVNEHDRASEFSHANEIAKPHYYKVRFDNGITVEISPAERAAHFCFSFPKNEDAYLVLDGYTKKSSVKIDVKNRQITGYVNNGSFVPENFKNYFVIQFDKPFEAYGTWENEKNTIRKDNKEAEGTGAGAFIKFKKGVVVTAKVASSYISPGQAQITLEKELGAHKSFEDTRKKAAGIWNQLLGRVWVEGGTQEQIETFYSCLFRASLFSRKFYELDKNDKPYYFSPYDGQVHEGYMFTDNGFWDTFRSQFPLTNILHPAMQGRYMNALLDAQEQCGWLPSWSAPGETGGMLGNHAISLITDAWMKGIRTFDPEKALRAYAHEAMNKGPFGGANGRPCWKEYYQLGYIPYPESSGSTAQTLESAYDDWCAYQLAKMTGNKFYEDVFARQMYNYRNVFDSSAGFMRGRKIDGSWADFDKYEWGGPYCEGNAWHYTWSVFHDVQGLIDLMGGDAAFVSKIDSVFSVPNTVKYGTYGTKIHEMLEMELAGMGQYAQGNQPIQHMIYLYNYAGQPWKTQYWIRQVMDRLYNATEKGYPGDEDQGGMSSWYVLSALGIYSVCPGTDEYVLGSPVFKKATITLENGNKFVIQADNNSKDNVYIQSASLNGVDYTPNFIRYSDIASGGILKFQMGNQPEKTRGLKAADKPFSLSKK